MKERIKAYCRQCKHEQTFARVRVHHGRHLAMTLLTLGLWGVSWLAICLGAIFRPWRCKHCGWHNPQFGTSDDEAPGESRWPTGQGGKPRRGVSPAAQSSAQSGSSTARKPG